MLATTTGSSSLEESSAITTGLQSFSKPLLSPDSVPDELEELELEELEELELESEELELEAGLAALSLPLETVVCICFFAVVPFLSFPVALGGASLPVDLTVAAIWTAFAFSWPVITGSNRFEVICAAASGNESSAAVDLATSGDVRDAVQPAPVIAAQDLSSSVEGLLTSLKRGLWRQRTVCASLSPLAHKWV